MKKSPVPSSCETALPESDPRTVVRTYKYRLVPGRNQRSLLFQIAGNARWIWNQCLGLQKQRLDQGKAFATYPEMCRWITDWRRADAQSWLRTAPTHTLQQSARLLHRAIGDFLRPANDPARKAFPRFKRRTHRASFRYADGVKLDPARRSRIWLPKIGWTRYRDSRPVAGSIKQASVVFDGDHWYVALHCEIALEPRSEAMHGRSIGIDVGVSAFAALSDGTFVFAPRPGERNLRRLARLQRSGRRLRKGGANWNRHQKRVRMLHRRIANIRTDFLHKISTSIAGRFGTVVIEDLSVRNMTRSAKGTVEQPGKFVGQKSALNRSILDQGWSTFAAMLQPKLDVRGGTLIKVPAAFTSQRCSACGWTSPANRATRDRFSCTSCGHERHADTNAAVNILEAAGRAAAACGGNRHARPDETGTHAEVLHVA
jgi:putative transposase